MDTTTGPEGRANSTPVVDTLHPAAENGRQRYKSRRTMSPTTLTGVRCVKRVLYGFLIVELRALEDLRGRPTTIAVSKRAKTAVKRSPASRERSKANAQTKSKGILRLI